MILNWHGILADGQGYSGSANEFALALDQAGVDVRVMTPSQKKGTGIDYHNAPPAVQKILDKPYAKGKVGVAYGLPNMFGDLERLEYDTKIGFTMFETNKLPDGEIWGGPGGGVAQMNRMDRMWTPSQFCKDLFIESGVTVPIDVINIGINTDRFPLLEREDDGVFTFLMLGTLTSRKDPGSAISAFINLFKDNPKVRLIMKTQSGTLGAISFPYDNIEIIDRLSTHEEILDLYRKADCFVFPSRGEGFGMPPMEAMSTGIPAIFPRNTGMLEFANEDDCLLIDSNQLIKADRFPKKWGDVGYFWQCDFDQLQAKMLWAYENQDEVRKMGLAASKRIHRDFNYDRIGNDIIKVLEDL